MEDIIFEGQALINTQTEHDYPIVTGREIYSLMSITGLNRSPVNKLTAYIMAGEALEGEAQKPLTDIPPTTMAKHLLIDGSVAIFMGKFIYDIIYIDNDKVVTNIRDEDGVLLSGHRRVYIKFSNIVIVIDQEIKNKEWTTTSEMPFTASEAGVKTTDEMLFILPNDKGLLWPSQKTFFRLEEIEKTIKGETDSSALATIITGSYTGNMDQAKAAFAANKKRIFIPGADIGVHNVFNGDAVEKLMVEHEGLLKLYRESMYDYLSPDTITMSGVSRRLAMLPTLQFVSIQRKLLIDIYGEHGAALTFEPFSILDSQEKQTELANVQYAYDVGAITDDEFKVRIRHLMSFDNK